MKIVKTVADLHKEIAPLHQAGYTVGLVPTMGALHKGHLTLVKQARKDNDQVVVSVFVNPRQFNNPHDLTTYPRKEADDAALLEAAGCDLLFMPSAESVYAEPHEEVDFDMGPMGDVMEGKMRPGHFQGVVDIVSRLFSWVAPRRAYFGEKDFQQLAIVQRMVRECRFPLEIVPIPIVRAENGLALSSRNARLSPEELARAPEIYATLRSSLSWKEEGLSPQEVISRITEHLNAIPSLHVEYYAIVDSASLQPIQTWAEATNGAVGCIACFCGEVRLIDNIRYA